MNKKNIETIVPLLPMQQGFLWQSLKKNDGSNTLQLRCTLTADLNTERFELAWTTVAQKHQALRSSVHWQDVKAPLQLVMKSVVLPWINIDLRSSFDIQKSLEEHLERDRQAPVELNHAPAFRLALYQTGNTTYELVWTLSHVLLDGWSSALVISQVVDHYSNPIQHGGSNSTTTISLNDHHRWLKQQDKVALLSHWTEYLTGAVFNQRLPFNHAKSDIKTHRAGSAHSMRTDVDSSCLTLDPATWSDLSDKIRDAGLSLNAFLQAAWAIQLLNLNEAESAVFGMTVSGREIDLPGANEHVGMLINLIPVMVKFNADLTVLEWLSEIQNQFFASIPFAHASLQEIQSVTNCQGQMFDSLLVLENQPQVDSSSSIKVSNFRSGIVSDMDLTLVVVPGDGLTLDLRFKATHFNSTDMLLLLQRFQTALLALPDMLDAHLHCLQPYLHSTEQNIDAEADPVLTPVAKILPAQPLIVRPVITRLEQQLVEIWQQILGATQIELTDNFFDLGGSSLQAVLIFERIQTLTGFESPTTILFEAPSIIKLAAAIEQQDPHSLWSTTVEIQKEGDKPPLFIPVISTDMLMYRNLSSHLGGDQPVYALRAADSQLTTDELALKLVKHIRTIQPKGPYHLAGASGAGLLAWAVAQKLQEQDQKVALLALLDTYGPDYPTLQPPLTRLLSITGDLVTRLMHATGRWIKKRIPLLPMNLKTSPHNQDQRPEISGIQVESNMHLLTAYNERIAQEYEEAGPFVRDITRNQPLMERAINLLCLSMTLLRSGSFSMRMAFIVFIQGLWLEQIRKVTDKDSLPSSKSIDVIKKRHEKMYGHLKPYAGRITYIKVTHRPPGVVDDPKVGWSRLVSSNMSIFEIPGTHTSMLKHPNVGILSSILIRELSAKHKKPEPALADPPAPERSLLDS